MEIVLEKKDKVNAALKINLNETDYSPVYKQKLKEYGKKVQLKGFRPGMVPPTLVEKMYGKSILVEEINGIVSKSINDYLKENKVEILGDPMPEEKSMQSINWDTQKDFQFVYNLGLVPDFSLEVSDKVQLTKYKISYTDKIVKETVDNLRKQFGKYEDADVSIADDIIYADATDESGKTYQAIIPQYRISETEKANFIGLTVGQKLQKDIRTTFGDDATIAHTLAIDKKEASFLNGKIDLTVTRISQQKLADLNEEFYSKVFKGGEVTQYEDFESKVKENIEKSYEMESKNALFNEIYDYYTEKTSFELPTDFLKNWLYVTNEGKLTKEQIESEYKQFEIGLKWDLIKNKVATASDIKIEPSLISERAMQIILSQFGMAPTAIDEEMKKVLSSMADNYLKKDNGKEYRRVFEQLYTEKVVDEISSKIKLKEEAIDIEKFIEVQKSKSK